MKVQTVTPYRVSHLKRYGVAFRGNVTSVYALYHCPGPLALPIASSVFRLHKANQKDFQKSFWFLYTGPNDSNLVGPIN
jgi:hypothetical protein